VSDSSRRISHPGPVPQTLPQVWTQPRRAGIACALRGVGLDA